MPKVSSDELDVLCAFDQGMVVRGHDAIVDAFKAQGWLEQSWHLSAEGLRVLEENMEYVRSRTK